MKQALLALLLLGGSAAAADRHSGYLDMGPELRSIQDDDAANPGMLWVLEGERLWRRAEGASGKSCADCHGEIKAMAGVAARYPAFSTTLKRPANLAQRINQSRTIDQGAAALAPESRDLLALEAAIARQSRGLPITPPVDVRLAPHLAAGAALFAQRQGQLNLSCANCHIDNAGGKLAGVTLPQGQANAYPVYRLEWQSLGSLQRRLRNCLVGMRAEPYAFDAPEYVNLELFLMQRAAGMPVEAPGVRP
jgi:sulfur-oxidizing protein SoxA